MVSFVIFDHCQPLSMYNVVVVVRGHPQWMSEQRVGSNAQ